MGAGLGAGAEAGAVKGGAGYRVFLAVVGLGAGAVLALGNVNGGVVMAVGAVDLDARLGVRRLMRSDEKGGWVSKKERRVFLVRLRIFCVAFPVAWSTQPPAPERLGRRPKQGGPVAPDGAERKRRGEGKTRIKTKLEKN